MWNVSILTRSEERVQLESSRWGGVGRQVSILTRSEERVQLGESARDVAAAKFQSSPAPKSGCN